LAVAIPVIVAVLFCGSLFFSVPFAIHQREAPRSAIWFGAWITLFFGVVAGAAIACLYSVHPGGIFADANGLIAGAAFSAAVMTSFNLYLHRTIQGLGQIGSYVLLLILQPLIMGVGLILLVIVGDGNSAFGVIIVWQVSVASTVVAGVTLTVVVARSVSPDGLLNRREILSYSLKSHGGTVLQYLAYRLDAVLVGAFESVSSLGIYSIATALTELAWTPATALSNLLWADQLRSPDGRRVVRVVQATIALAITVAVVVVCVGAIVFLRLIPAYRQAFLVLVVMAPGVVVGSAIRCVSAHLYATGRPVAVVRLSALGALVAVIVYPLGLWAAGILGAALASSFVYSAQFIGALVLLKREFPSSWSSVARIDLGLREMIDALRRLVVRLRTAGLEERTRT